MSENNYAQKLLLSNFIDEHLLTLSKGSRNATFNSHSSNEFLWRMGHVDSKIKNNGFQKISDFFSFPVYRDYAVSTSIFVFSIKECSLGG